MQFNYAKEKAKFEADWAEDKKLLQSENASEELIEEIYQVSLGQFNSDRNYYLHKEEFSSEDELSEEIDLDENLDFIDKIENGQLLSVLRVLTRDELNIIRLHYEKKLSLLEISYSLGQRYDKIQKKLYRAKNKIKKNLK